MGAVMTLSYLGAFLDPVGNARDLPIALVNEDAGATVAGQRMELGARAVGALTSPRLPLGDAVQWTLLRNRREALARIGADTAFAAVVIPRDYSRRIAALAAPARGLPVATRLTVLTNLAADSFARSATGELATSAVMDVSMQVAKQLAAAGPSGTPAAVAHRLDDGTVMISVGVEFLNGHLSLDLFALGLRRPETGHPRTRLWATKLVLALALSVLAGVLQTVLAVEALGMTATNPVLLGLFAVLGIAAAATVTLAFLVPFGLAGSLLGSSSSPSPASPPRADRTRPRCCPASSVSSPSGFPCAI